MLAHPDLSVEVDDSVTTITFIRPPNNFLDVELVRALADALEALSGTSCRAVVLASSGKHFCAGLDLSGGAGASHGVGAALYAEAARIFDCELPIIAAVQGAAVGGGLGLACAADFRIGGSGARFEANFARLGFHHGFALSVTLPQIVGMQASATMLLTARRVDADAARSLGLLDQLVGTDELLSSAQSFARQIGSGAPLAVQSIRSTLRRSTREQVRSAMERELAEQVRLRATDDWAEGVASVQARRAPVFRGQ